MRCWGRGSMVGQLLLGPAVEGGCIGGFGVCVERLIGFVGDLWNRWIFCTGGVGVKRILSSGNVLSQTEVEKC